MLSDYLKKFEEMPYRTLLWIAAGLVLVCQLVAVAFVADEQVTKAQIRDFQRKAEMQAVAQCMTTRAGAVRQSCIQQARVLANSSLPPAAGDAPKAQVAGASGEESVVAGSKLPVQPSQGFMSASFALR